MSFRYLTAGESHGIELTAVIDGLPSGLALSIKRINADLKRRQGGYGRGGRMLIEKDKVRITSGVRHSKTLGSPVTLTVPNRDWANWDKTMSVEAKRGVDMRRVTRPRPGHADLTGAMKYSHSDIRNVLERSSARETAVRVAVGAVAKALLATFGIEIYSYVTEIGGERVAKSPDLVDIKKTSFLAEASELRCPSRAAERRMKKAIDGAKKRGDSLGGLFEVVATGVPPGLGSYVQWDRKLDARLAGALMSIQAIKSVEVGLGRAVASTPGSKVHDEIFYAARRGKKGLQAKGAFWPTAGGFYRKTNRAGGIEGGMSNGEPIVLCAAMKPIPTLYKPLQSADIDTKKAFKAAVERSDICAVPAASVVAEAVVAIELAANFLEKFAGDSVSEIKRNYRGYLRQLSSF